MRPLLQKTTPSYWKQLLRKNFNEPHALADFLELNDEQRKYLLLFPRFALNVPIRLAQKMTKGTLDDPLLKQFIPLLEETVRTEGFIEDPVGDSICRKDSGLLQKYEGRVLLVCTSACAMHCRFCFRQNFDYRIEDKSFTQEIKEITNDPSLSEVILSGGDPLSLSNELLDTLLFQLGAIPHIKRIRFHTRFPIGIPERIDDEFIEMIERMSQSIWFVVHVNHPRELDEEILERFKRLQRAGCVLLSQTVLLKGVNDDVETLQELCELLTNHGIVPYYLHQLDRVQGAAHFEVTEERGKELIQEIAKRLPGYGVPKYVREIFGEPNKTPL